MQRRSTTHLRPGLNQHHGHILHHIGQGEGQGSEPGRVTDVRVGARLYQSCCRFADTYRHMKRGLHLARTASCTPYPAAPNSP